MTWFDWTWLALVWLAAMASVGNIGAERKPLTKSDAVSTVALALVLTAAMLYSHG